MTLARLASANVEVAQLLTEVSHLRESAMSCVLSLNNFKYDLAEEQYKDFSKQLKKINTMYDDLNRKLEREGN